MFIKATLSALALAVSIPALASAGQGSDMLAKIAGVPSGEYTDAELILIDAARDGQDDEYLNFLLTNGSNDNVVSRNATNSTFSAGHVQLAQQAGVEPGRLSTGDLNRLIIAQRNGDVVLVKFLLDS
jgi:hypothetical protein